VISVGDLADGSSDNGLLDRLRASEELYARAFLTNPVAMSTTNVKTDQFTHINLAFAEMLGYTRAEILGRSSDELSLWPDRERRPDVAATLQRTGRLDLQQATIRAKGGSELPVLVAFQLLSLDSSPSVLSVLVPLAAN
jgi:PAS domain S-box-containing protein